MSTISSHAFETRRDTIFKNFSGCLTNSSTVRAIISVENGIFKIVKKFGKKIEMNTEKSCN